MTLPASVIKHTEYKPIRKYQPNRMLKSKSVNTGYLAFKEAAVPSDSF